MDQSRKVIVKQNATILAEERVPDKSGQKLQVNIPDIQEVDNTWTFSMAHLNGTGEQFAQINEVIGANLIKLVVEQQDHNWHLRVVRRIAPVIFGCSGYSLTSEETNFFKKHNPLGFILFRHNIDENNPLVKDQVKTLVAQLKSTVSHPTL